MTTLIEIEKKIDRSEKNLQRKLEWISRYDTRIAFVSGIAIAMLGVLASASGLIVKWECFTYFIFGLASILLLLSLIFIYFGLYPKIKSPNTSLLFFGTIADMKFDEFKKKFKDITDEEYLDDLLCQTHINAEILKKKFSSLKTSLVLIGVSTLPWIIAIYLSKMYLK